MATHVDDTRARTHTETSVRSGSGAGRRRKLPLPLAALLALIPPAIFLCFVLAAPQPVRAAGPTFTVNSTLDEPDALIADEVCQSAPSGKCTLRAAIQQAEYFGGAPVNLPAGTYVLTLGHLNIKVAIALLGAGAATTIVDGNGSNPNCYPATALSCRVFDIPLGSMLSAYDLTVRNGKAGIGAFNHYHGAGIHNHGTLDLRRAVVSGNHVAADGWGGGGITNAGGSVTYMEFVTINGNTAKASGGGIENLGTIDWFNVTISNNAANGSGGGIYNAGAGQTYVRTTTIAGNLAPTGGGVHRAAGTLQLDRTILAGNSSGNCAGAPTSTGYNLSSDNTCALSATGDQPPNTDPQLGPLADTGGQLPTHRPAPTSPAINAIPLPCGGNDQRGVTRPQGSGCDIGAVELNVFTLTLSTSGGGTASGAGSYAEGAIASLTATPGAGQVFLGWTVNGAFAGWASPATLTMSENRTVAAAFAPRPSYPDVTEGTPYREAIGQLAARQIIRGFQNGTFQPGANTLRAQMAALIARAMGWENEDHQNPFPDQGAVDAALWRNVGTLAFYNVARGFPDGTYKPVNNVAYAQTISFITRAMVAKGYWTQQPDSGVYPNVPASSGHRQDIATYVHYVGALPAPGGQDFGAVWAAPSTRAWFAEALWQALNSYWGVDRLP